VPLVTVREYMLAVTGVALGFAAVFDDKFEPLHKYTLAPPPPFAARFTVPPTHIGPSLAGDAVGVGAMVTTAVAKHVVGNVYVMVEVPAPAPVIIPDDGEIIALPLLLVQPPLLVASDKVIVPPTQMTVVVPFIIDGKGSTVTAWVAATVPHILVTV